MEHLVIEQNSNIEVVSSALIGKLYECALDCDSTSDMRGNLQTTIAKKKAVDWLMAKFPQLQINCTQGYYLDFEDPEWEKICAETWGDGIGVTLQQMESIRSVHDTLGYNNTNLRIADLRYYKNGGIILASNRNSFRNCPNFEKLIVGVASNVSPNSFNITGSTKPITVIVGEITGTMGGEGIGGSAVIDLYAVKKYTKSTIGDYLGRGITINKMYIGSTNPCAFGGGWGNDPNSIKQAVYFPIGTANAWKQQSGWSDIADRIHEYDFDNDPDGIFAELDY